MDTSIFFFINKELANVFLDIAMPFITDRAYLLFLPIVIYTFFKDKKKTIIALSLCLLALALGDSSSNILKHLFERERPCQGLEGVRQLVGCGRSFSFPSSHSVNAFAIAATFSYFFRRTAFLTFIIAALVALSRIYLGVHYPSDVIAGAAWGSITAWVIIDLYKWASANYKERPEATIFMLSLAALTFFRYYYILTGPLDLSPDEAHYWEWSRRLDLSYYSKGPMIAWLIAASTWLMGDTLIGIRFLAPIFLALSSMIIYFLTLDIFHGRKNAKLTACAAGLMFQLTPLFAAFGVVMTIDSPFIFFWILSLYLLWKGLQNRENTLNWVLLGICVGMGLLTKYTMAFFFLCTFFLFIFSKEQRINFRIKGPYIALLISLLVFSPVIIWNAGHEWATLKHTAGQAHIAEGIQISFKDFFEFIGSQIGLLSPLLFFMLFYGAIRSVSSADTSRTTNKASQFLFWFWFPVITFFLLKSLQGKVQANWAMPAYITVFIAGAAYFLKTEEIKRGLKALSLAALTMLVIFFVITHYPSIISLPVKQDPTSRLQGWEELGKKADTLYSEMSLPEGKKVFIFSDRYQVASELAFYMKSHPVTYNINLGRRMNQYDMWEGFEDLLGHDSLFVRKGNKPLPAVLKGAFDSYSKEVLPVYRRDKKVLREYSLFKCYNFRGINKRAFDSY